jgi:hypothetical protein
MTRMQEKKADIYNPEDLKRRNTKAIMMWRMGNVRYLSTLLLDPDKDVN